MIFVPAVVALLFSCWLIHDHIFTVLTNADIVEDGDVMMIHDHVIVSVTFDAKRM